MGDITIRLATAGDLDAINDIYNYYVVHSTCTYQTEPETIAGRREWFAKHGGVHPVTVAETGGVVVGWGSIFRFRPREAYARSVENSVYVHHDHHRKGVGRLLLADLIDRARDLGHHTIVAGIDAEQPASVALHAAAGFERVAYLKEVGFKFDCWLHVIYMQKML